MAQAIAAGREWLDAEEVAEVLAAYGIPCPACRVASAPAEAARQAAAIGGKVALKIRSRDIMHKSDVGGVALGLAGPDAVERAAEAMLARVKTALPEARIDGFLVQQMVERPGAIELILGVNEDANFGPIVLFGQGGTLVEFLGDTTLELPPHNAVAGAMRRSRARASRACSPAIAARPPPISMRWWIRCCACRNLACEQPQLRELDINPLLADKDGVVALDARIRVAGGTRRPAGHPALSQGTRARRRAQRRHQGAPAPPCGPRTSRCCRTWRTT